MFAQKTLILATALTVVFPKPYAVPADAATQWFGLFFVDGLKFMTSGQSSQVVAQPAYQPVPTPQQAPPADTYLLHYYTILFSPK